MAGLRELPLTTIITLVLGPSISAAQAIDRADDPVWTNDPSAGWCFASKPRRFCLPRQFRVSDFDRHHARWVLDDGENAPIHLWYDSPSTSFNLNDRFVDEPGIPGRDLEVTEATRVRTVIIYELSADTTEPSAPQTVAFILMFRGNFSLMLFSQPSETDRMRDIGVTIAQSWHASDS